ncbi:hypothetical protein [Virgibacillus salinus]|uniref:Uncharacterized protein n=1 Tax=Virgibacillus salinus TaxID=553311 RepID=A0A1H1DLQ2_9BACI|nr:hypothetical protein [Virgibacillus salinus]SDQ77098.1 hypothetical protein SAMN05216231_2464 [Virgibacillus salinus]
MTAEAIKDMRKKQFFFLNITLLISMTVYVAIINYTGLNMSYILFTLGAFLIVQSVSNIFKKDLTKSWVPIIEQVNRYEKEIMGSEWKKQNKTAHVINLVVGCMIMIQAYFMHDINSQYPISIGFFVFLIIFLLLAINITMLIHTSKVDNSNNTSDFNGYTWKFNLIGFVAAMVISVVIFILAILFVLSRN